MHNLIFPIVENIPEELKSLPQWVPWEAVSNPQKPKPDKFPVNPRTSKGASTNKSTTWGTFADAVDFYNQWKDKAHTHTIKGKNPGEWIEKNGLILGVGFVLTENDPYVGIDLDNCITDGVVESWAQGIIDTMKSYTEKSPSGKGLHIFVKGRLPPGGNRRGPVEMYADKRYLTVTGVIPPGMDLLPIIENQAGIDAVHQTFIREQDSPSKAPPVVATVGAPPSEDEALLAKIGDSKQGKKFNRLWAGETTGFSSQSEADLSLCSILAFWTAKDADRMDRLFRRSRLYRPKWDEQHGDRTYGMMTIAQAIANTQDVYREVAKPVEEAYCLTVPPPVPLEAFPVGVRALLVEAADAFGVPSEIPVAAFLALLSCLVGRSRMIQVKPGWCEAGNLWLAVVAKSGMGKSPVMTEFFRLIYKKESNGKQAFDMEMDKFKFEEKVYHAKEKAFITAQTNPQKRSGTTPLTNPIVPVKPVWKQAIADDITPEALGDLLQGNPKGVLWMTDELATLVMNLDRYTGREGGTKARLLSAHNSGPWKVNRSSKSERNILIPHACVGIFGGVQPGALSNIFQGGAGGLDEETGLLPRFIFIQAVAERPSYFSKVSISKNSRDLLQKITDTLWGWDVLTGGDGAEIEQPVMLSVDAEHLFIEWYDRIAAEAFMAPHAARLKKLQAHALRLCLLLHCLDAVISGNDGNDRMTQVSEDCMRRALLLADWIKAHQEQVWPLFDSKQKTVEPVERAIMEVVVEHSVVIAANGWVISNDELFQRVNTKLGIPVRKPHVGKVAIKIGLEEERTSTQRGKRVTPEVLKKFQDYLSRLSPVTKPEKSMLSEVTEKKDICRPPVTPSVSPQVFDSLFAKNGDDLPTLSDADNALTKKFIEDAFSGMY
ncbi:DUF3987 domain-containing protein [Desulfosarcina sp. OttesenSCG-928-A07]|nr:DUF3987 domain-containing protein [Desulfosarcina sp. OttesenSCG-928-G17]MDL2329875.1 DUF3987 domain-containing protein [Desulfosarcina sp. OttesenSCG-928-A07]